MSSWCIPFLLLVLLQMVKSWQTDMPGGVKVTIEGKVYSATTDLCSGGIFFKRPVNIERICTHGYFFQRPNGCSMNNSDIISGRSYVCSNSTHGLVQALIPLTPPELPTEHSIAFYDEPNTLKNFRRYAFSKGLRHQYSGSDAGAVGVVVANTHNTPKIGIGHMCYEGKPSTAGAAFQTDLPWSYSHRGSNSFFARKCREDSYFFQWRRAHRFPFTEGYSDPEDFKGEIEAVLGDDGRTEKPTTEAEVPFLTFPEEGGAGGTAGPGQGSTELPGAGGNAGSAGSVTEAPGGGATELPFLTFPEYGGTGEPGGGATELPFLTFPEYGETGEPGGGATEVAYLTFPENEDTGEPGGSATDLTYLTFPDDQGEPGGPGVNTENPIEGYTGKILGFPDKVTENPVEGYTDKILDLMDPNSEKPVVNPSPGGPGGEANPGGPGSIEDDTTDSVLDFPENAEYSGSESGEGDKVVVTTQPPTTTTPSDHEIIEPPNKPSGRSVQPEAQSPKKESIIDSAESEETTEPSTDDADNEVEGSEEVSEEKKEPVQSKSKPANQPSVKQPSGNETSANQPSAKQPPAKQISVNQPAAKQPSIIQPSASQPSARKALPNQPSVRQATPNQPSKKEPPKTNPGSQNVVSKPPLSSEASAEFEESGEQGDSNTSGADSGEKGEGSSEETSKEKREPVQPESKTTKQPLIKQTSVNQHAAKQTSTNQPSGKQAATNQPSPKPAPTNQPSGRQASANQPSQNDPPKTKPGSQIEESKPAPSSEVSGEQSGEDSDSGSGEQGESKTSSSNSGEQNKKPEAPSSSAQVKPTMPESRSIVSVNPTKSEATSSAVPANPTNPVGRSSVPVKPQEEDNSPKNPEGCTPAQPPGEGNEETPEGTGRQENNGTEYSGTSPGCKPAVVVDDSGESARDSGSDEGSNAEKPEPEKPIEQPPSNPEEGGDDSQSGDHIQIEYPKPEGVGPNPPDHIQIEFPNEDGANSEPPEGSGVTPDPNTGEPPPSGPNPGETTTKKPGESEESDSGVTAPSDFEGVILDFHTEETPTTEEWPGLLMDLQTEETPKSEEWPGLLMDLQTEETPTPGPSHSNEVYIDLPSHSKEVYIDFPSEEDDGAVSKPTEKPHPGIVLDLPDRVDDSGNVIDKPSSEEEETPETKMTEIYRHSPIRLKPIPIINEELTNWDPYVEEAIFIAKSKFLKELGFTEKFDFQTGKVGGSISPSVITEQPKAMWFQILKSSAEIVKAAASEEILNPEFIDDVVSLFGYIFRTVPDDLKSMDDSILQSALGSIQKCQSAVKKVNISMTGCPAKFHHVEVANEDGTSNAINLIKSPPMESSFRTHRNDVIVESVWNIVDIVLCSCFDTFVSESVNAYHALHAYMVQTFLNERVQRRWYSAFKGVDAYAGILPQGYFKTVMYNYDKLKASMHLSCQNLPWISKPEFLVPNYAYKNVFRSSKKYSKSNSLSIGRAGKVWNSIKNGDNDDPFVIGDAALTFSKPFQSRAYKKNRVIWRVKRQIELPMEEPVLEKPLTRTRREANAPDNPITDKDKLEIWGGMAYCLQANYIESSNGKFDMRGIIPSIESLKPLCSEGGVTTEKY